MISDGMLPAASRNSFDLAAGGDAPIRSAVSRVYHGGPVRVGAQSVGRTGRGEHGHRGNGAVGRDPADPPVARLNQTAA